MVECTNIDILQAYRQQALRKYHATNFELDYNLWKKLRQMEECKYSIEFKVFVDYLQEKLFRSLNNNG